MNIHKTLVLAPDFYTHNVHSEDNKFAYTDISSCLQRGAQKLR